MNDEKRQKLQLILLSIIIVFILGVFVYLLFFKDKKDELEQQNIKEIEERINNPQIDVYKTKDGMFTFKVVDKNNQEAYQKSKKKYETKSIDQTYEMYVADYGVKSYLYVNNDIHDIVDIKEDDNYASYTLASDAQYPICILVDKKSRLVEENPERLKILKDERLNDLGDFDIRFNGENNTPTFIKTNAGYYFGISGNLNIITTIYTTNWKELGVHDDVKNIKSDNLGIWVYAEIGSDFKGKNATKYDINGNIIDCEK